jgi:hypothetical protein
MKATKKSTSGTSFHDTTIRETPANMINYLGEPHCIGGDKTNMEWEMETSDGTVFTIYDWKNYEGIEMNEVVEWHIGGHSEADTEKAREELITFIFNS